MTNEEAIKVISEIEASEIQEDQTIYLKYGNADDLFSALDFAISALKITKDLADMDYVHNFQREAPWVVEFCHKVTNIQRRAKEIGK